MDTEQPTSVNLDHQRLDIIWETVAVRSKQIPYICEWDAFNCESDNAGDANNRHECHEGIEDSYNSLSPMSTRYQSEYKKADGQLDEIGGEVGRQLGKNAPLDCTWYLAELNVCEMAPETALNSQSNHGRSEYA